MDDEEAKNKLREFWKTKEGGWGRFALADIKSYLLCSYLMKTVYWWSNKAERLIEKNGEPIKINIQENVR